MKFPSIYVETHINATVDEVWARTQEPKVHQRWDVRFTDITYLERVGNEPQRFVYATRVGPGLRVDGRGETLGERHRPDRTAYSGLKFWSDHWLSLILEGAGYWRYVPTVSGTRFLTRYDYRVRWGAFGKIVDRILFRPVFGWATAWSFDRLRLWIENGIAPERSRKQTVAHTLAVLTLAFVWIYHGIVPKLLYRHAGEFELLTAAGAGFGDADLALTLVGLVEVGFGISLLRWWRHRWPFLITLVAMPVLTLGAFAGDGSAFARPFNPITLNIGLMALAAIALLTRNDLPSGRRALRHQPREIGEET